MRIPLTTYCPTLIGRDEPMAVLDAVAQSAARGTRAAALISGDAGIGKSRLLRNLLDTSDRFRVLKGRSFENDRFVTLAPVFDTLGSVGTVRGDLVHAAPWRDGRLDPTQDLAPFDTGSEGRERRRKFERLADLLERHAHDMSGETSQATSEIPTLLAIEDIHWADESTLDFLLFLLRHRRLPDLMVLTFRENEGSPALLAFLAALNRMRVSTEIKLPCLDLEAVSAMLASIFELPRPPRREFARAIARLTDGNPLFVEETLSALVQSGQLSREGVLREKPWLVRLEIPRSVQLAVAQRLPSLDPDARSVLEIASVIGQRFDFGMLASLTGQDFERLLGLMRTLVDAQLVVEESVDVFAFRHSLTRQAIYRGLLARERLAIHGQIADALAASASSNPDTHVAETAFHYCCSEEWEKAAHWAERAAKAAEAANAPEAAAEHFSRAILALEKLGRTAPPRLFRGRAHALEWLGQFREARADVERLLATARADRDAAGAWQCLLHLAKLSREDDIASIEGMLDEALAMARQLNDGAKIGYTLALRGFGMMMSDRPHEACAVMEEALRIFGDLGDHAGQAAVLDSLGWSYYISADLPSSNNCFASAAPLLREVENLEGLANSLAGAATRGADYFQTPSPWPEAELEKVIPAVNNAVAISRNSNWRSGECRSLIWGGLSLGVFGEYGLAFEWAERGLQIAREDDQLRYEATAEMLFGALWLDMFEPNNAREHLDRAMSIARSIGSPTVVMVTTALLARALGEQGEAGRAAAMLERALDPTQIPNSLAHRLIAASLAEVQIRLNRLPEALSMIDRLFASAPGGHPPDVIPHLTWLKAEALARAGEFEDALKSSLRAAGFAQKWGLRPLEWRARIGAGRVLQARRKSGEAAAQLGEADGLLRSMAGTIPDEAIRLRFLSSGRSRHPGTGAVGKGDAPFGLTPRELEVAHHLGGGLANRAIARRLGVSQRTVEKHVENVLSKMMVRSRVQAAIIAADWPPPDKAPATGRRG